MLRVIAVVVLVLLLPSSAAAGTVAKEGTSIVWTGTADADTVTIEIAGGMLVVTDTVATTPGAGCTAVEPPDPTKSQCPVVEGDSVTANGGEQNDSITCRAVGCVLNGESGDDTLIGGAGAQTLAGGPGSDTFVDAPGAQVYAGGDGVDTASYAGATDGVAISLDGVANDGPDGDDVGLDVENLIGGAGLDTLTGSDAPNRLDGGGGGDTINGAAGPDQLVGSDGDDDLGGGAGPDELVGGDGSDELVGSEGDDDLGGGSDVDTLDGEAGIDVLAGGEGNDTLRGGSEDDLLAGGAGADVFSGGEGSDAVDYSDRTDPLEIRLDGTPSTEGDVIGVDVEDAFGGSGADTIFGNAALNILDGGLGADVIRGGDGNDSASYLLRDSDLDVVLGGGPVSGEAGEGDDLGTEVVLAGAGNDRLTGVGGSHGFFGGDGDDLISSRDGDRDIPVCEAGDDTAIVDEATIDFVDASCEHVDRPGGATPIPSPPGPGPAPPSPPAPIPSPPQQPTRIAVSVVAGQSLQSFRSRGLRVRVTCPTACRARLDLVLSRRNARRLGLRSPLIAQGFARLSRAGRVTAVAEATARAKRRLRTVRQLRATLEARVTPARGRATTRRVDVTLRRASARRARLAALRDAHRLLD